MNKKEVDKVLDQVSVVITRVGEVVPGLFGCLITVYSQRHSHYVCPRIERLC